MRRVIVLPVRGAAPSEAQGQIAKMMVVVGSARGESIGGCKIEAACPFWLERGDRLRGCDQFQVEVGRIEIEGSLFQTQP